MVRTESKPDPQKQLMIKVKACQRYDELFVVYIFIISISFSIVFLAFCGLFFLPCIILPSIHLNINTTFIIYYRLVKEATYYEKELKENEAKLQQMKDENKDQYDIKKFQEVVGESQMMIPDSSSRRDKALEDLKEFVALLKKDESGNDELMKCEWMVEANKIVGVSDADSKVEGNEGADVAETAVEGLADGEAF